MEEVVNIDIKEFKSFTKNLYKNDTNFIDTKTELINIITKKSSAFYKNSKMEIVAIKDNCEIMCQCIFIYHKNNKNELMLSFFESKENALIFVKKLVEYGKDLAKKLGATKLLVGIDGHCNNAIGFRKSEEKQISFGYTYNHTYYSDYFIKLGLVERKFVSFIGELENINFDFISKFGGNIEKKTTFSNGLFKLKNFKKSLVRYTDLSNKIFNNDDHFYCFKREYEEDYELFKSLLPLLNKDSLLIVSNEKGEDIGFILWYYDFYEMSKNVGVKELIKHKIFKVTPKNCKIVEIGVLPEYQNTGLILTMLKKVNDINKLRKNKASIVSSSWIYDKNVKSKKLTSAFIKNPYLEFFTYELKL